MPWKNGGGVTRDVAVFPPGAGLDDFAWRLSIADVHVAGPFSHFAGIDRSLSVLEGRLELVIVGVDGPVLLSPDTGACIFPGDVAVSGRPLSDAVRDLNLMVRRDVWRGTIERLAISAGDFDATIAIVVAGGPSVITVDGKPHALEGHDALLIDRPHEIGIDATAPAWLVRLWPA